MARTRRFSIGTKTLKLRDTVKTKAEADKQKKAFKRLKGVTHVRVTKSSKGFNIWTN